MKLFVWDLHGTLEQGNEHAAIDISNEILEHFGYSERFSSAHTSELYGLKWHQYFEHLLPGETPERCLELQAACFELSNSHAGDEIISRHMQPAPGALDALAAIAGARHDQVLLSNTTPESLVYYIKSLGLDNYFNQTNAIAVDHHSQTTQTKVAALKDYLGGKSYEAIVVIGDSNSDMDLADAAGTTGYLYAHPGLAFRTSGGNHHQIHDLRDVLHEL